MNIKNNDHSFLLLASSVLLVSVISILSVQQVAGLEKVRTNFRFPNWFNFDSFKEIFNRHYGSFTEELVRRKIYLGRAVQAFVSCVQYKYYKVTSYLAVNLLSDKTVSELARLRLAKKYLMLSDANAENTLKTLEDHDDLMKVDGKVDSVDFFEEASELPLASPEDIQRELAIIEQHSNEPGFHEIAEELRKSERSAVQISPSKLNGRESSLVRVESNNPNYEPVARETKAQLKSSFSIIPAAIPNALAGILFNIPGANYVRSMVGSLANSLTGLSASASEISDLGKKESSSEEDSVVYVDLRDSGCLLPVRNQDKCGACYAFAGIALYEYLFCMATGKQVAFSEQYIVDCGDRTNLGGCDGGTLSSTAQFIEQYGLELLADRPFANRQQSCPFHSRTPAERMGYIRTSRRGSLLIKLEMFDKYLSSKKLVERFPAGRPILVGILTPKKFDDYGGGVDLALDCSEEEGGHALLVVGHGREDGIEYYLIRNSYSSAWGLDGYYKLSKEALYRCAAEPIGLVTLADFDSTKTSNPKYALKRSRNQLDVDVDADAGQEEEQEQASLKSQISEDVQTNKRRRTIHIKRSGNK